MSRSKLDPLVQREIWARLARGESLAGLVPQGVDGRLNLSGIAAPAPEVVEEIATPLGTLQRLGNLVQFRGITLRNLDFSRSRLSGIRFFDSEIANCVFDRAD